MEKKHEKTPGPQGKHPLKISLFATSLLCLLSPASVNHAAPPTPPESALTIPVDPDAPGLQRATQEALRTLSQFRKHLQHPDPDMTAFAIKALFKEGDMAEQLWIADVVFEDGVFHGRINNDPESLKRLKYGDPVRVRETQITDWMIIKGRRMIGGYTIRAIRETLDPKAREKFDEDLGLEL